jgi:hypothetical protein
MDIYCTCDADGICHSCEHNAQMDRAIAADRRRQDAIAKDVQDKLVRRNQVFIARIARRLP